MLFNTPLEKAAYAFGKAEAFQENSEMSQNNYQLGFEEGRIFGYQNGLKDASDDIDIDDALCILKNSKHYKIVSTLTLENLYKFEFMTEMLKKYSLNQLKEIFSV